eukprot:TRINITY_DN12248_c0_g1_i1.p1 TRINITY_DN12248_c0_g1~~TRINITY_DN12248_c0_g1_i1.p1  ORF type:complete len:829 (-),score=174.44 TRINITY_DN12248_c0_g1_i1:151-2637(-)
MSIERIVASSEDAFLKRSVEHAAGLIRTFQRSCYGSFIFGYAAPSGVRKRSRCLDLFRALAGAADIDWARVIVLAMDETFGLPSDAQETNAWLVREGLIKTLQGRGIRFEEASQLVVPDIRLTPQEQCAQDFERQVRELLEREKRDGPNLVMMCLEEDLSVASIFPDWYKQASSRWLQARAKQLGAMCTEDGTGQRRVCLNLRSIRQADAVVLLLDQSDDPALEKIIKNLDPQTTPARMREVLLSTLPSSGSQLKIAREMEEDDEGEGLPPRRASTPAVARGRAELSPMPKKRPLLHHRSSFLEDEVGPNSPLEYVLKYCNLCTVQFRKSEREHLTFVVCGAAGDLAKKKTFPSLFHLHLDRVLPSNVHIIGVDNPGYNKDVTSTEELWERRLKPYLEKEGATKDDLASFRAIVEFHPMDYADIETVRKLNKRIEFLCKDLQHDNRVFYLALPPFLFQQAVAQISQECSSTTGSQRYVVEKPFGKDLKSARELTNGIAKYLEESQIYRIDHYLAKTMALNILTMRFSNRELGRLFHADNVANVRITFKEDIDCAGRAGYFDGYGIIRDIMQNHLLQLLTLVAMEAPASLKPEDVRDEKVKVLKQIRPISPEDCVVGQYDGYQDDEQIQDINKKKGHASKCATFAVAVMYLDNERWSGVPFIMKAGKSLEQRSTIIRLQFKSAPPNSLFGPQPQNELIMRVQPDEAIYYKILAKSPGLNSQARDVRRTVLDMDLKKSLDVGRLPEAYEKLIFDVIQGESHNFVRRDEVEEGWRIFDPLLAHLEGPEGPEPERYAKGSRGPQSHHALIEKAGFRRYTMTGVAVHASDDHA